MAIIVPILSTFDDKGIKSAIREFKSAKTGIDKFGAVGKIFEGVGKKLTKNVTLPIIAVGGALASTLKPAIEAAAAQQRLTQILTTTGTASKGQIQALLKQAEALEQVGVVSRENVIATQSQLATFDLQGTSIEKLTPAILDYVTAEKGATASTEDFKSMTNSLAQALNGQFGGLTRVGFVLDEATKKQISNGTEAQRTQAIIEVLNSTYKGFNQSLRDTPEGQLVRLQNALGKVREEIGTALLPLLARLSDFVTETFVPNAVKKIREFTKAWNDLGPTLQKIIIGTIVFSAVIGPALIVIGKIIGALYGLITALGATKVALALTNVAMGKTVVAAGALRLALIRTGIGAVVILLAALAAAFVNAWETSYEFRNRVRDALNSVVKAAEIFVNVIIERLNALLPGLNAIIRGMQAIGYSVEEIAPIARVAFTAFEKETRPFGGVILHMSERAKDLAGVFREEVAPSIEDTGKKADELKAKLQEMRQAVVRAAQSIVDDLNQSLRAAQGELDEAQRKFNDFKNAIAGTITGILNFGKAADESSFLEGLMQQAADATLFADKIKQLILLGLSEKGIQQVLSAGFEAGSAIADELIAGGATMVQQVNTLVSSVESIAEQVGDYGARQFYQVGVTQGEAIVAGILAALKDAQAALQAAQVAAVTGGAITSGTGPFPGGQLQQALWAEAVSSGNQAALDYLNQATQGGTGAVSAAELAHLQQIGIGGDLTHPSQRRALGGLTLGGRPYLVGEHGPEVFMPGQTGMITPNHKMGGGIVLNVYAGVGTDGMQVGRQIVDAIKRFEKQSGPVFAKA
jgi:hypothetical protein